ncbi:hypothetical protein QIA19_04835 (plasmid) [Borreliella finlandensis]|uniref:Lipoprotein n=1 Tax=Borreliella finlandensis TaxID=498741 RepID=A0A806CB79_9SPIR|nr:hypothetical protein [Borreliella finlandensis]ACN93526.1 conserved hypothetical protein [Borreliella finlandensis]
MKKVVLLILMSLISSCKWYENKAAKEVNKNSLMALTAGEQNLNELSERKIKTLSTQDLLTLASEAKIDAEKSNEEVNSQKKSKKNSKNIEVKDTPKLVKAIKKSSEKIDLAFKALIGSGYNASPTAKSNLENGLKMINLLDELLKIAVINGNDNSISKYNDLKKAVDNFNNQNSLIKVYLKNSSNEDKIEAKKCIKTLMRNVETYFEGVYDELKDENKNGHNGILTTLNEAIGKIKNSAMTIHVCFNIDQF